MNTTDCKLNKIVVFSPSFCISEMNYTLNVCLKQWLSIDYTIKKCNSLKVKISRNGKEINLPNTFFKKASKKWLALETLPKLPLGIYHLENLPSAIRNIIPNGFNYMPVLYGDPDIRIYNNRIDCRIDLIGSIFFMLTRYEEAVLTERDEHDRFPATASVAYKEGFLDRPIVNEYVELLWGLIKYLWPDLKRKPRSFRTLLSHDVDDPFDDAFRSLYWAARRALGDLIKRKNFRKTWENLKRWYFVRHGNLEEDRNNTFNFITSESEKRALISSFYFLSEGSHEQVISYNVYHPIIQALLVHLDQRGHEIGLHTSYNSYLDEIRTRYEADVLRKTLIECRIKKELQGVRQHYLRIRIPKTLQNLEAAGLVYDSSLGFADKPGFRCGTCWEYPLYDLFNRVPLKLIERPLVVMECTVIISKYMGLGLSSEAFEVFKNLKDTCRLYHGDFTLLWHNTELITNEQKEFYIALLDA